MGPPAIELPYRIVDVFSDTPLAGNPLCVVLDAVPEPVMGAIAREVNLSETTFVTVTGPGSYDVRIFTPAEELPFAGHPSLGTAWALGPGRWAQRSPGATVVIDTTPTTAVLSLPDPVIVEADAGPAAAALGLPSGAAEAHVAEAGGTRHVLVLTDHPLARLGPAQPALLELVGRAGTLGVGVARAVDDRTMQARVWIPSSTVFEDPGTGSAAAALGLLGRRRWGLEGDVVIRQGAEVGRPCRIEVHAVPGEVRVGGPVAACAEGRFTL